MSGKTGLDRLQKELDVLTYNSRTVLNALIKSVMTSGSSRGFTVTRANEQISISNIDIYRIRKFYDEWEDNLFHKGSQTNITGTNRVLIGFDDILLKQDAIKVKNEDGTFINLNSTTDALVRHSKILYQNSNNVGQVDSYWLNLIKESNNPKLVSNTAPIVINLRTPVFDSNLATTKYNTHPTYLFPTGYYGADALGFSGDGIDHSLSGGSWNISSDNYINIDSDNISLGSVNPSAPYKTKEKRTGIYSLSLGYDSHAQGDYCIAGGNGSIVPSNSLLSQGEQNTISAISLGEYNIASENYSSCIGGSRNSVCGFYASILGGWSNTVIATNGIALGGRDNQVGGKVYEFVLPSLNNILVRKDITQNFIIGDQIRVFDYKFGTNQSLYLYEDGSADKSGIFTITNISYVSDTTSPNFDYTNITLDRNLPNQGFISGGKVSKYFDNLRKKYTGENSVAFGYNNIASGVNQLVSGIYNEINLDALLIIGNGTNDTDGRANVFEVNQDGFSAYGLPKKGNFIDEYGNEPTQGFVGSRLSRNGLDVLVNLNLFRIKSQIGPFNGMEFINNYGTSTERGIKINDNDEFYAYNKNGLVTIKSGDETFSNYINGKNLNLLSDENIYLESHKDITLKTTTTGSINLFWDGKLKLSGNSFGALPTDSRQFNHDLTKIKLSSSNYIPVGSVQQGAHSLFNSGFYTLSTTTNPILDPEFNFGVSLAESTQTGVPSEELVIREKLDIFPVGGSYHLLNIGHKESNTNSYSNLQFIYGTDPTINSGHIGVRRSRSKNEGDAWIQQNALSGSNLKRLAWYEDIIFGHPNGSQVDDVAFGNWVTVPSSNLDLELGELNQQDNFMPDDTAKEVDLTALTYNYYPVDPLNYNIELRYTKINKTLYFQLYLNITNQSVFTSIGTEPHIDILKLSISSPYNQIFSLKALTTPNVNNSSCFSDMTYFRNVRIPNGDPITETVEAVDALSGFSNKIYNCHAINDGSSRFLISTSMSSWSYSNGLISPAYQTNKFVKEVDINRKIFFSGFYAVD